MARTKKTVVSGITREQAEQAFADFAAADAQVQNLTSKMDIEMTRIREKYADQLAELSVVKEKTRKNCSPRRKAWRAPMACSVSVPAHRS